MSLFVWEVDALNAAVSIGHGDKPSPSSYGAGIEPGHHKATPEVPHYCLPTKTAVCAPRLWNFCRVGYLVGPGFAVRACVFLVHP
eukprot:487783-Amphidinium_carterae.1